MPSTVPLPLLGLATVLMLVSCSDIDPCTLTVPRNSAVPERRVHYRYFYNQATHMCTKQMWYRDPHESTTTDSNYWDSQTARSHAFKDQDKCESRCCRNYDGSCMYEVGSYSPPLPSQQSPLSVNLQECRGESSNST